MSLVGVRILGRASVDAPFDVVVWEGGAFVHGVPVQVVPVVAPQLAGLELTAEIGECRRADATRYSPPMANMSGDASMWREDAVRGFSGARIGIGDANYGVQGGMTLRFSYTAGEVVRLAQFGIVP